MKKYFALTIAILIFGAIVARAQDDEIIENANAPVGYDANLRAGARAVAKQFSSLKTITIVSKSGGVYRATFDGYTDTVYQFRANNVYPYFDLDEFGNLIAGKEDLIAPYLECYAKKHNQDSEQLKGSGFSPPYHGFSNAEETRTTLQGQQAQLAQLETKLKNLAARPDTFMEFTQNPAVWYEIAAKRAEYLPCVLGDKAAEDVRDSPWLRAHRDGVKKTLATIENYRTGDALGSSSEYAFYAVSPKMRAAWLKEKNALDFEGEIDKLLKPLADALNEKLPTYFPNTGKYALRSAAEEALMQRVLPNPARQKIFKIGLAQSAWQIDKGTLGIPQARYKNGLIYRRDSNADHPYCYATYVNVIQDYAGGGTYAASRSEIIREELVACPAGK